MAALNRLPHHYHMIGQQFAAVEQSVLDVVLGGYPRLPACGGGKPTLLQRFPGNKSNSTVLHIPVLLGCWRATAKCGPPVASARRKKNSKKKAQAKIYILFFAGSLLCKPGAARGFFGTVGWRGDWSRGRGEFFCVEDGTVIAEEKTTTTTSGCWPDDARRELKREGLNPPFWTRCVLKEDMSLAEGSGFRVKPKSLAAS